MDNEANKSVLARIMDEVRAAEMSGTSASTTAHSVYVTGLFELDEDSSDSE